MKLRLACVAALAAALAGCGEQEVDPDPYGLSKVTPDPNAPPPTTDAAGTYQGGPGQPGPGGAMPQGYPMPKNEAPAAEAPPAKAEDAPKTDEPPAAEPAKGEAAAALSQEEIDEIKKLPADEQAQALAQAVCVISGENLGSMGKPVKVEADGKTAFLCCKGCVEDFEKDPKAALAKLEKK